MKNGDVLLAKPDEDSVYLCVVECKGGSYRRSWVEELSGIAETLNEENEEVLKEQLGVPDKELKHVQLVLLAKSSEASRARREIDGSDLPSADAAEARTPYDSSVWGCDIFADRIYHELGDVADKRLSEAVKNSVDYAGGQSPVEYVLKDHALIPLRSVIFRIVRQNRAKDDEYPLEFDEDDFHELFSDKLQIGCSGDKRENLVQERSDWLLRKAEEIGIVTDSNDRLQSDRDYRILFKGSNPPTAEEATEDKYIEHEAQRKVNEVAFDRAKDEFDLEQRGLDEF